LQNRNQDSDLTVWHREYASEAVIVLRAIRAHRVDPQFGTEAAGHSACSVCRGPGPDVGGRHAGTRRPVPRRWPFPCRVDRLGTVYVARCNQTVNRRTSRWKRLRSHGSRHGSPRHGPARIRATSCRPGERRCELVSSVPTWDKLAPGTSDTSPTWDRYLHMYLSLSHVGQAHFVPGCPGFNLELVAIEISPLGRYCNFLNPASLFQVATARKKLSRSIGNQPGVAGPSAPPDTSAEPRELVNVFTSRRSNSRAFWFRVAAFLRLAS